MTYSVEPSPVDLTERSRDKLALTTDDPAGIVDVLNVHAER
jgi:hypothetical protein